MSFQRREREREKTERKREEREAFDWTNCVVVFHVLPAIFRRVVIQLVKSNAMTPKTMQGSGLFLSVYFS